jgi:hypothetical protein
LTGPILKKYDRLMPVNIPDLKELQRVKILCAGNISDSGTGIYASMYGSLMISDLLPAPDAEDALTVALEK